MKNISRRVFIKGLAVAGVAAAASTVLAGCNTNMIPGVGDDQDTETPESPVTTITFTDPDDSTKTLTIVSKSFALGEAVLGNGSTAEIEFQVDNKLKQTEGVAFINVGTALTATGTSAMKIGATKVGSYYVKVSAYADGNDKYEVPLSDSAFFAAASAATSNFAADKVSSKKLTGIDVTDYKSLTVKLAFMKVDKTAASNVVYVSKVDSKEFTYTL